MYFFISRDPNSSVYKALEKYLLTKRNDQWKKKKEESFRFNLMLGDRNRLPYTRLGQIPGLIQLVNYYRGSEVICRKCRMIRELKRYCTDRNLPLFPWLPASFVIIPKSLINPADEITEESKGDYERNTCLKFTRNQLHQDERKALMAVNEEGHCVWIAKSSVGSKGDDIMISRNIEDLLSHVDSQSQSYIIQQYINNPFLLNHNRKFDIRCWVLLDSNCDIYLFKEGVLRTASETYNSNDLSDVTSHLTNHSLQEQLSPKFGMYEEGNEMFYDQFNSYLVSCGFEDMKVSILPQIRNIIKICFSVIKEGIHTNNLTFSSFQLFGFDFLLDEEFKVWLLEINGAPACAQSLLPKLIESLVATAIDPVFPPSGSFSPTSGSPSSTSGSSTSYFHTSLFELIPS